MSGNPEADQVTRLLSERDRLLSDVRELEDRLETSGRRLDDVAAEISSLLRRSRTGDSFWANIESRLSETFASLAAQLGTSDPAFPWIKVYPNMPPVRDAVMGACLDREEPATHFVTIQGVRCKTLPDFARTWGDALEFPSYYGGGAIGSFEECFRDLVDTAHGGIGSRYRDRPGRPVKRLVISVADAQDVLRDDTVIGPAKIIRIIDKLISEIPRRCDLRVIYYLGEGIEPKQLHTQVGLVYPHEHVHDYRTD
ncbi:hypothetical protein [Rhodococcus opacus]|uniref:hypothetical protein n=1 Tax=Rhodococcus opacus TaxID=37919 RepID=UPI0024B9397C|nr:hypothetical protein [Rhodococcus opacus]MDJ0417540.1 hypothetical protein [Rhodococcus opacus]